MANQQRNNKEEWSEIKRKGKPTEEFNAGIKGNDEIKQEWEPNEKNKLGRPSEERKLVFVGPVKGRYSENGYPLTEMSKPNRQG